MTTKMSSWMRDGAAERVDGWVNVLTGIGALGRDKRLGSSFKVDLISRAQAEDMWRGDDMAARIIETLPDEMVREGFELKVQSEQGADETQSKRIAEDVTNYLAQLDVLGALCTVMKYERAYGGGAILLGADDGAVDMREPLDLERVRSLRWLTVLDRDELYPTAWYSDPYENKFGQPMLYNVQPQAIATNAGSVLREVHESRLILFRGIAVSRRQARENNGWGDSVLTRVNRVLADFGLTWGSASVLLQDFAQAIIKIKDLAELLATNDDDFVVKRMQAIDMSRSTARAVILDSEEGFERHPTPMTGMPEMLDKFALRLSAAAEMPVTLLMGQAPAGLNATGASDVRFFYDRVRARQRTKLLPQLMRIVSIVLRSKEGPTNGRVPANWSLSFNPLWQMTDNEIADIRLKIAQADQIYLMNQVATPEEIAVSRFGGDSWSMDTMIDLEARRGLRDKPPEMPTRDPNPDEGAQ